MDDLDKLNMPASAKRLARRKGLKSMMNTKLWDKTMVDMANEKSDKLRIKKVGQVIPVPISASLVKAQAKRLLEKILAPDIATK